MRKLHSAFMLMVFITVLTHSAAAQIKPQFGIRAGFGTDINLGLAYGVGGNLLVDFHGKSFELGVVFFGGNFKEESEEYGNIYREETNIAVFGLLANYLYGYEPRRLGLFLILGVGLASISVDWEERSPNDYSLGTPLPNGGTMQSEEGTNAGTVTNVGLGYSLSNGVDLRIELPTIWTFAATGGAAGVVPTLMATVGYRF